jgi:hypothetical protein
MTEQVKQMLDDLGDWRGTRALYIRELILKADSDLSEQTPMTAQSSSGCYMEF